MQKARIKLSSTNHELVDKVAHEIKELALSHGTSVSGPVPLPTKRLKVVVRKAVSGDGTETWDRWEMRVHKRILDVAIDERTLRHIMRIELPHNVNVEIELID